MDLATLQKINALERRIAVIEEALRNQGTLERPPESPKPVEVPFATCAVTNRPLRVSLHHPMTVVVNYVCPTCHVETTGADFNVSQNGAVVVATCKCGEQCISKLKLEWNPATR
jgi:hypothetical protein